MAKQHKIKRYHKIGSGNGGPPVGKIVLTSLGFLVLLFIGFSIYTPIYEFFVNGGASFITEREPDPEPLPEDPSQSGEEGSEAEPEEPVRPNSVSGLKAVFMPVGTAGNAQALESFLQGAEAAGANAVMVDIKDSQGQLLYRSENPSAVAWEAVAADAFDLEALAQDLSGRGMHLIARMATFSDPIAARGDRTNNPIHYQGQEMLWLDNYAEAGGKPWLNPYAATARAYLCGIAEEAAQLGAVMVVFEGYQFPDDGTGSATFGETGGMGRGEVLALMLSEAREQLSPYGARVAVYLNATELVSANATVRYGGDPLEHLGDELLLNMLPGVLGGGSEGLGVASGQLLSDPAGAVTAVLDYVDKTSGNGITVIPMIRGGSDGEATYTAGILTAKLEALTGDDIVLYASDGVYFPAA